MTRPETRDEAPEARDEETGEELPERMAMSLIKVTVPGPAGAAAALTVLSDASTAIAEAEHSPGVEQRDGS